MQSHPSYIVNVTLSPEPSCESLTFMFVGTAVLENQVYPLEKSIPKIVTLLPANTIDLLAERSVMSGFTMNCDDVMSFLEASLIPRKGIERIIDLLLAAYIPGPKSVFVILDSFFSKAEGSK